MDHEISYNFLNVFLINSLPHLRNGRYHSIAQSFTGDGLPAKSEQTS